MEPHPYQEAFAARDLDRLLSLLADDVIFHSPVINEPFEGRDAAAAILAIAVDVLEETQYTHDLGDGRSHVLVADARALDEPIKTTTLLEFDADGKIREIWIMARPLTGVVALAEAVGRRAESQAPVLSKPLDDLAAVTDRVAAFDRAAARVVGDLNRSAT
jgi:hypothetical protein